MVRAVWAIILVSGLGGCTVDPGDSKTDKVRLALTALEKECGVGPGTVSLGPDDSVTFQPAVDEKYERLDCVARGLTKPEFADHVKIGFVGNGAAASEEKE